MISNAITLFRTGLALLLLGWLIIHGPGWVALAVFLIAGGLDVLDGKLARALNETSPLGAVLDLIGDRLLTLAAVLGLVAADALPVWALPGAVVLVVRCIVVAGFSEALGPGQSLDQSRLEPLKIVTSFLGLSLAMLPFDALGPVDLDILAGSIISLAGALTLVTLVGYVRAAVARLRQG
ncbi:CDP-alcohol phosphatidyltransferase family protein [Maricaulis maris]|jgi:cardiolipin synthase (CMP-forming)|uniref:CDP-alcohol phosphatidyltransferase family protein n=1 Tax=Maricaulis maris TaxID=74318 RepID=UPI00291D9BFC|nr:CDP-diacylglycerol--glycerol-3-phosphate 3-phosphatidyltransferase [Maricaulis maris]